VGYLEDPTSANTETAEGVEAGLAAAGWSYHPFSFDPSNPSTLDTAATNALAEGMNVVLISSIPPSLFSSAVIQAYLKAKVPIEILGTGPGEAPFQAPFFGPSTGSAGYAINKLAGTIIGNWYVANSRGKSGLLVATTPEYASAAGFTDPLVSTVKSLCSSCKPKVVDLTPSQIDGGQIASSLVSQLRANPSIKYLVFDFGAFTSGIYADLQAAGLSDIKVAGQGPETTDLQALKGANKDGAWAGFSTYYVGYNQVDIAIRKVMGLPATTINLQPTQLITSKNVGNITEWNKPTNTLAQFEKLWKVPVTPCTLGCSD
jgi:ribose transport system substrate-binding protein